jgi:MbtH protein
MAMRAYRPAAYRPAAGPTRLSSKCALKTLPVQKTARFEIDPDDTTIYKVVVDHEDRYSIWPARKENPLGWRDIGKAGLRAECLSYIRSLD